MPHLTTAHTLSRRSAVRLGGAGLAAALSPASTHAAAANDSPTLAANKTLAQRLFMEGINVDDENLIESLYAADAILRNAPMRQAPGPAGMPMPLPAFRADFPDVTATIDAIIAEGDLVAAHVIWYGSHPPKGRHIVGRSMHLFRITGARIVEEWNVGWEWIDRNFPRNELPAGNPLLQP